MLQTKYTKEEIARRGEAIYENQIRPHVEAEFNGKILVIDIESGDYEIGDTTLAAADLLKSRRPDAEIYVMRIGYDAVYSFHGLLPKREKV
jgi:hypothetical protein